MQINEKNILENLTKNTIFGKLPNKMAGNFRKCKNEKIFSLALYANFP